MAPLRLAGGLSGGGWAERGGTPYAAPFHALPYAGWHARALWDKGAADDDDADAESLREAQAENRRQLIISMASDFRAIPLLIARRLAALADAERRDAPVREAPAHAAAPQRAVSAARRRLARDALAVHAPLARRLGMHHFVAELQQFAFKALHPEAHAAISAALSDPERAERHEAVLAETTRVLRRTLHEDDEIVAGIADLSVVGRKKTAYSVWRKMQKRQLPLERIDDVLDTVALRVVLTPIAPDEWHGADDADKSTAADGAGIRPLESGRRHQRGVSSTWRQRVETAAARAAGIPAIDSVRARLPRWDTHPAIQGGSAREQGRGQGNTAHLSARHPPKYGGN